MYFVLKKKKKIKLLPLAGAESLQYWIVLNVKVCFFYKKKINGSSTQIYKFFNQGKLKH